MLLRHLSASHLEALLVALALVLAPGCGDDGAGPNPYQADPELGATEFVSAAAVFAAGGGAGGALAGGEPSLDMGADGGDAAGGEGAPSATVEEGDIFRLLGDGLLLNLNSYRGLQVIDVADPSAPAMLGQLRVGGSPVELYVVGDEAIVLLNSWTGYYASTSAGSVQGAEGGVVLVVDLSDPAAPVVTDSVVVGGDIRTSRLVTSGGGEVALYVATSVWEVHDDVVGPGGGAAVDVGVAVGGGVGGAYASSDSTVVASYELTGAALEPRSTLDLGGWVSDIQATPEALLVARHDWSTQGGSQVAVIDISDPGGQMVEGADVEVSGVVESQFNMDLRGTILRVVSGGLWLEDETNHVETWDVTELSDPQPLDHATFGDGEQLYATLFVDDRAFFVTYLLQDPFHAFEITEEGAIIEHAEFVVSGWNDFFVAAHDATRLVGIGVDDEDGARKLAVSLYDITDLDAVEPLVQRAELELDWAWTEASWDHRAFAVLEGAVSVEAPGGGTETGLVLLPFTGWADEQEYQAGVQLFTFSADSVTARAAMDHGSPVRRSFLAEAGVCGNLSETTLTMYETADPDAPVHASTLELAPDRSELFVFGDHVVRVERTSDYWWYGQHADARPWSVQVVEAGADADSGAAVAELDVLSNSNLWQVGELLVAARLEATKDPDADAPYTTTIDVWDLSTPAAPEHAGSLTTTALEPGGGSGYYGGYGGPDGMGGREPAMDGDCWDCGWAWYGTLDGLAVGDALVFRTSEGHWETAGTMEICQTWYGSGGASSGGGSGGSTPPSGTDAGPPVEVDAAPAEAEAPDAPDAPDQGSDGKADSPGDVNYTGSVTCVGINGGAPLCVGKIFACDAEWSSCEAVDASTIPTTTDCWDTDYERYWQQDTFQVLDLSDPTAPALGAPIETAEDEEGTGVVTSGATLYHGFAQPFVVPGDDRPYLKHYVRPIDLSTPSAPALGPAINVPGWLLLAEGDALYTMDQAYNDTLVESALSRVALQGEVAVLEARHRFAERAVSGIALDGAGHAVVVHTGTWLDSPWGWSSSDVEMSVLDAATLEVASTTSVGSWATLRGAAPGQALFQVSGGVLTVDLSDPAAPAPQAFFATQGWPEHFRVSGDTLLVAAGRYGIYSLDLTTTNLLAP